MENDHKTGKCLVCRLDIFTWGYVKDSVYRNPVFDIATLRHRITRVITSNPILMVVLIID